VETNLAGKNDIVTISHADNGEKQNRWLIVLSKGGCLKGNASNSDRARPIFSLIYSNWIETDR
jgi:hypothetical protein